MTQKQKNKKIFTLSQPRVTEKASSLLSQNVYVFNVPKDATKPAVKEAVKKAYKVTPVQIRIINMKPKQVFVRGRAGQKAGGRKAYIYLKKGESIEIK